MGLGDQGDLFWCCQETTRPIATHNVRYNVNKWGRGDGGCFAMSKHHHMLGCGWLADKSQSVTIYTHSWLSFTFLKKKETVKSISYNVLLTIIFVICS